MDDTFYRNNYIVLFLDPEHLFSFPVVQLVRVSFVYLVSCPTAVTTTGALETEGPYQ